jgi:hypothetical protein
MRTTATWGAALFLLAGIGDCQSVVSEAPPPGPDAATYGKFFSQVAMMKGSTLPAVVTEKYEVVITRPGVQETLGLTDAEMEFLNSIASDCVRAVGRLTPSGSAIFEARLRSIESGETLAQMEQRQRREDGRRDQVVLDRVEQLKKALGDSRFATVEAFLRGKTPATDFFPMIGPPVVRPRAAPAGK